MTWRKGTCKYEITILLVEILATNISALCRSASLAFSFVFSRSSDAWHEVFHKRDPAKLLASLIPALCGPLHSNVFIYALVLSYIFKLAGIGQNKGFCFDDFS